MSIHWADFSYIYYGLIVTVLYMMGLVYLRIWRKKRIKSLAESSFFKRLAIAYNPSRVRVKNILRFLVLLLLTLSVANPREYAQQKKKDFLSCELVICLDISNSMLADDISPSRLEYSKQVLFKLLPALANDKVGLVVYAGAAAILQPITSDIDILKGHIRNVKPDYITRQGTHIEEAIDRALSLFDKSSLTAKALLLITDGEEHEGSIKNITGKISDLNVKLIVLGTGTKSGGPIPITDGSGKNFKRDAMGNVVITKLDETRLKEFASKAKGIYFTAGGLQQTVDAIKAELDTLTRSEESRILPSGYSSLYYIPLILACILILIDLVILDYLYFIVR
ncbi:MAG: VWA domain-containing protein [Thermaurantimonas sp.]